MPVAWRCIAGCPWQCIAGCLRKCIAGCLGSFEAELIGVRAATFPRAGADDDFQEAELGEGGDVVADLAFAAFELLRQPRLPTLLSHITGDYCPACAEVILDAEEAERYGQAVNAFPQQVNAASVDPAYIAAVRKKLALDQREAAAIFGGGDNAFSRYENGKTRPPLALVKLLKVLDRHPELLNEVRAA